MSSPDDRTRIPTSGWNRHPTVGMSATVTWTVNRPTPSHPPPPSPLRLGFAVGGFGVEHEGFEHGGTEGHGFEGRD